MRQYGALCAAYAAVSSTPCTSTMYYPDPAGVWFRRKAPYDDVVLLVTARHYLSDVGLARQLACSA